VERDMVGSIEAEFQRYKALGEGAMDQLVAEELGQKRSPADNSITNIVWHIAGNLKSRFTDFLTSDGEKPWRERDSEFEPRQVTPAELQAKWEEGWGTLFESLSGLKDGDLHQLVSIRGLQLPVHEALHRSLAHASYHVGQIVYVSKLFRGDSWNYLSIPPGGSEQYNRNPVYEKPPAPARVGRGDHH
jgi:hypothetical protein